MLNYDKNRGKLIRMKRTIHFIYIFFTFAHQVDALKMIYQFDCMFIYREENYSAITSSFSNYKVTFKRDPNKHS